MKNKLLTSENHLEECPFCNAKNIQERIIVENTEAKVFPTNIPIVPGHLLIVPQRHIATFSELTPKEIQAIFIDIRGRVEKALKIVFKAEGFNYAWNEGEVAGQSVQHFHLHVLPRKHGDKGITKYEPRKFIYRPGSREVSPDNELLKVSDTLKKALPNLK